MKKRISLLLCGIMAVSLLAGCGGGGAATGSSKAAGSAAGSGVAAGDYYIKGGHQVL